MNAIPEFPTAVPVSYAVPTSLGRLHVVEYGHGPETIVLWPSIFTDHHIYDDLVATMGASHRFLLIDGPAHGQSEGGTDEFTMEDCAKAMGEVMDRFDLVAAIVGGTSWGGITAAHLALMSPARIKALVLMNTPMQINAAQPGLKARFIACGARWALKTAMFRNGVANSFFSDDVLAANASYANAFHTMLKTAQPASLAAAIQSVILRSSPLMPRMAELTVPTLVIAGKEDAMYPIAVQAEAALLAPNGHFEPIEGKHISVVERPKRVADALTRFIASEVAE
ncbi:alpha/beta fold hydrolase [Pontivivens insulae]|uniref:3-oxoadipate enol-lactonase 2 n=1 Tax=Pontivivens insulae TaxID=1639689 RepID=A0A2R8AGF0_9RHOB|nr:alpha/beta hydrolase [Pontivivens insulae]RED10640.1 pimeloyl-ACP methyl ester carboxylesterase [Pontivivens insulae]SPF31150.1 3-oxoadipate enol-lactonase 2 [Pontivivens insulae]